MRMMAPEGKVYQAGTLSGNPLAMTAGIETLRILKDPDIYRQLDERAAALQEGIAAAACQARIPLSIARAGSLLTVFFTECEVRDYSAARSCDTGLFARFFNSLLSDGIYWPPSQFEADFVSLDHSPRDIETTIRAAGKAFKKL